MANVNAPFGARLIDSEGKEIRVKRYVKKTGSAIYAGDFVKIASTGDVEVASASGQLLGVALEYKAATSTDSIAVIDDPEAIFEIQASANLVAGDVFANAQIVATTGDTVKLTSKHALDSANIADTATHQLKILGLSAIASNEYGSYAKVKVKINNHAFRAGVLGA
jgi:hypothetical protein